MCNRQHLAHLGLPPNAPTANRRLDRRHLGCVAQRIATTRRACKVPGGAMHLKVSSCVDGGLDENAHGM